MEKKKPHYDLALIKSLIESKQFKITAIARNNALESFGFFPGMVIKEILSLEGTDFYKSMTTNNDNKIWQDVYHKPIDFKIAYIKIQIVCEKTVIIQFKEK